MSKVRLNDCITSHFTVLCIYISTITAAEQRKEKYKSVYRPYSLCEFVAMVLLLISRQSFAVFVHLNLAAWFTVLFQTLRCAAFQEPQNRK